MNDPVLAAQKLEGLARLAGEAETEFEKAAVFAAATVLCGQFRGPHEEFDGYILEKVEGARWHIAASLGFDVTNGHDAHQHRVWALGEIDTLHNVLRRHADGVEI